MPKSVDGELACSHVCNVSSMRVSDLGENTVHGLFLTIFLFLDSFAVALKEKMAQNASWRNKLFRNQFYFNNLVYYTVKNQMFCQDLQSKYVSVVLSVQQSDLAAEILDHLQIECEEQFVLALLNRSGSSENCVLSWLM